MSPGRLGSGSMPLNRVNAPSASSGCSPPLGLRSRTHILLNG